MNLLDYLLLYSVDQPGSQFKRFRKFDIKLLIQMLEALRNKTNSFHPQ